MTENDREDDDVGGLLARLDVQHPDQWIVDHISDGYVLHRKQRDVKVVHIEVTTRCNLECPNCVRNVWKDPLTDMEDETFRHLMDSLRKLPELREVHFGGYGEPLLHPRITEIVKQVKSLGVRTSLITNGTLLDQEKAKALMDSGLDRLFVSIDSPRSDLFGKMRDGAELDRVIKNLKRVKDLRKERGSMGPTIGLEMVITDENLKDIERIPSLGREVGASMVLLTHLLPHNERAADRIAYDEDHGQIPRPVGWGIMAGDFVMWGTVLIPRSKWGAERKCRFIEGNKLVVGWDGAVSPCYALMHSYPYFIFGDEKHVSRYELGNVNDESLADIWTSEEYVLFRARVREFDFPSCVDCGANCDYRQENSDCVGNEISCADCLWAQDIIRCP